MDQQKSEISDKLSQLKVQEMGHPLQGNNNEDCETAEEAITTDSEDYLSEPLRYRNFQYSTTTSNDSNSTLVEENSIPEENANFFSYNGDNLNNIQIPIVGYEIMEERARFTVYKLRIENKVSGDCWYVFRRYTDFVRLCNRIRNSHTHIVQLLPRKRWLKNNFDPLFLEERVSGLQTLVNAILAEPSLITSQEIQDFFCLNEPPIYSETNEESRAMFEALEETINDLKVQLREKDAIIDSLQDSLHSKTLEADNLLKIIKNSVMNCQKCQKECENFTKLIK
ncbi:sorting nexin-16 [Tribolium castaneum]|uniref:Sorting nexin-16-like Protein n=1 Tax=Tribolium castaneum TaxID=7070 RepID=D6WEE3_TRICA|nr:PREDICTED: sorting nexin-16 [Tribolium castaneum]EFA00360.1 Sorting nexin-16-like Protein [Tribolium castaneum]|eukprot:XP_971845.3 PREDICTED: sorting nexin-16 [Tribolium castaneum]